MQRDIVSYTGAQIAAMRAQLAQGASISVVARDIGPSRRIIYRIQEDPAEAEAISAQGVA